MNRTLMRPAALLLVFGLAACNAISPVGDDDNDANEVQVTVQALGTDYLDADDGSRYEVTGNTMYEGFTSFADATVGAAVDIEYEAISNSTNRRALEIEDPTAPDTEDGN